MKTIEEIVKILKYNRKNESSTRYYNLSDEEKAKVLINQFPELSHLQTLTSDEKVGWSEDEICSSEARKEATLALQKIDVGMPTDEEIMSKLFELMPYNVDNIVLPDYTREEIINIITPKFTNWLRSQLKPSTGQECVSVFNGIENSVIHGILEQKEAVYRGICAWFENEYNPAITNEDEVAEWEKNATEVNAEIKLLKHLISEYCA